MAGPHAQVLPLQLGDTAGQREAQLFSLVGTSTHGSQREGDTWHRGMHVRVHMGESMGGWPVWDTWRASSGVGPGSFAREAPGLSQLAEMPIFLPS